MLRTPKIRNIIAGHRQVALVVDDLPSFEPFIARGIRIYGTAEDPIDRVGMVGPGHCVRVAPTISWSWNLEGAPAGDTWRAAPSTSAREERQYRDREQDMRLQPVVSAAVGSRRAGDPRLRPPADRTPNAGIGRMPS